MNDITIFVKIIIKSQRSKQNVIYLSDFSERCVPIFRKLLVDRVNLLNQEISIGS